MYFVSTCQTWNKLSKIPGSTGAPLSLMKCKFLEVRESTAKEIFFCDIEANNVQTKVINMMYSLILAYVKHSARL